MPSTTISQKNHLIAIETPLGKDVLCLQAMTVREELGRLFQIEAELVSENHNIDFDKIIGENVTLRLETTGAGTRYFNGYVSRFIQAGGERRLARYEATIVPWLWILTRRSDCRIYQNQNVPDIIQDIFKRSGVADLELRLSANYVPWEFCVQYRETDFNFVSRLMEQEGIYYFFKHESGRHTLVLCDSPSAHETCPGYAEIKFRPSAVRTYSSEHILEWTIGQELQTTVYAHTDFDFKVPSKNLVTQASVNRKHAFNELEMFDYPGEYTENDHGTTDAKVRIQEIQSQHELMSGHADARGLLVGHTFTLQDHPRNDQCRGYLILSTHHSARTSSFESENRNGESDEFYKCSFTVMDAREPFRPQRLTSKPVVQGPQTATVVGPSGQEIYVDDHARVKVQFHWDRHGKKDENSSCWIRVAQPWAGRGYGGLCIPRIGQEVIVEFLEGDPDQPIINGRVYNADNKAPVSNAGRDGKPGNTKPSRVTQAAMMTSIRSQSLGGSGGHNEITLNDTAGAEGLFIKAQKDEIHRVGNDREREVGNNETVKIGGNMNVTVAKNKVESVAIASAENVGAAKALNIGAAYAVSVGAGQMITVGGARMISVGLAQITTVGETASLKAKKVTITAEDEIAIKVGGAKITMKSNGDITIKGNNIKINGTRIEQN